MSEMSPSSTPEVKPPSERSLQAAPAHGEQRQYPRFKLDDAMVILSKGGLLSFMGLGKVRNRVVNLSQGGVLVLAAKSVPVETRLHVRIEVTKPEEILECEASVRWCAQSARDNKLYYVGLCFEKPGAKLQKKIEQMRIWFTSPEYRTQAARKEASSMNLKPIRLP
jgi:hypothetical protein